MRILIIEDEPATAKDLAKTIQGLKSDYQILDILDTVEAARDFIGQRNDIDLIFSDIQLADGLCFEIFKSVEITCPVIFCTAYDHYAIEAFQNNGIDYLVKPFNRDSIANSIQKLENLKSFFFQKNNIIQDISTLLLRNSKNYKSSFLVSYRDKFLPVSTGDIAFFHLEGELLHLHTFKGQQLIINETLEGLESQLNPEQFYRANRQFIINRQAVAEIENYFARKLFVKLSVATPESLIVSKAKASDFLKWMEH